MGFGERYRPSHRDHAKAQQYRAARPVAAFRPMSDGIWVKMAKIAAMQASAVPHTAAATIPEETTVTDTRPA
jgi:hypothetical protein